jgi:hypothetical protein
MSSAISGLVTGYSQITSNTVTSIFFNSGKSRGLS